MQDNQYRMLWRRKIISCHACRINFLNVDWIEPRTLGYCSEGCAISHLENYLGSVYGFISFHLRPRIGGEP